MVVLAPDGHERRLVVAQVLLELGVGGDVRAVVEDEVVLHFGTAWQVHIIVIKAVAVGAYAAFWGAEGVLADDGLKGVGRRELLAELWRGIFQYSLRASHFLPKPSSYILPFCEIIAVIRSGCHIASR